MIHPGKNSASLELAASSSSGPVRGAPLWPRPRPSRAGPAALGAGAGAGEARRAWGASGRGGVS